MKSESRRVWGYTTNFKKMLLVSKVEFAHFTGGILGCVRTLKLKLYNFNRMSVA